MMMQDALPSVKSFFRKAKFTDHAQDFVLRMIIAFMFHIGRMSASQGAVAIRTSVRHRAQVTRFLHGSGLANPSSPAVTRKSFFRKYFRSKRGRWSSTAYLG